ncbi:MAG TPA: ABC transporter permease [Bacteroidota bacterium]|nr:ABC transporter permease [Bacteroidota bacterium]
MQNKSFRIAKWEYLERVKTKAFIIGLFMMPTIIAVFTIIPSFLASKADEKVRKIGVIDETDSLLPYLSQRIAKFKLPDSSANYELVKITDDDSSRDHLKILATAKILDNEIEGYFLLPSDVMEKGKIEYRSENVGNIRDQERFSKILEDVIIERRLEAKGYNSREIRGLSTDVDVKTIKVSSKGEEKESGFLETFFTGYIFIMMLFMLVMTSGQMLIRSLIEEKSNRIVEVLMSSCSPSELLMGKILGLSLLGLTTISFWLLILVGVNFTMQTPFVSFDHIALLLLYFVLGYLLYVAIFVTAGAPVSTEQEAQQMTAYVTLLVMFPIALAVPAMQNPDSLMVKVLSQIPLLTPTMMALRLSIQAPDLWEIALSLVTLSASIVGMMWVAGKVFRIGILLTGKRPNFKEMYRWITTNV